MSHEHITSQKHLEDAINRGIDILCISNYTPAVPAVPISGYEGTYEDWTFVKDEQGRIQYETDEQGNVRYKGKYRIPVLKRTQKIYKGGFANFRKKSGEYLDLNTLPQLPNGEHTHYTWPDGVTYAGYYHVNFIGTFWSDAVNGSLDNEDLALYNSENNCSLTRANFRLVFPLWTLCEMIDSVKSNLMFPDKVFGTFNHPGNSKMQDWHVDELMKYGEGVFKAMSIYNNSVSQEASDRDGPFYDHTLLRGIKLWCVAEDDWGRVYNLNNPEHRGCNLLYLDSDYVSKTVTQQAEMALDAYISGCFSAVGYGTIDLLDVNVKKDTLSIVFNCVPDRTVIDIDGERTEGGSVSNLMVVANSSNTFIRFEAYKDDDFIFTQPFYIERQ